jgi:hypothetical protein
LKENGRVLFLVAGLILEKVGIKVEESPPF